MIARSNVRQGSARVGHRNSAWRAGLKCSYHRRHRSCCLLPLLPCRVPCRFLTTRSCTAFSMDSLSCSRNWFVVTVRRCCELRKRCCGTMLWPRKRFRRHSLPPMPNERRSNRSIRFAGGCGRFCSTPAGRLLAANSGGRTGLAVRLSTTKFSDRNQTTTRSRLSLTLNATRCSAGISTGCLTFRPTRCDCGSSAN